LGPAPLGGPVFGCSNLLKMALVGAAHVLARKVFFSVFWGNLAPHPVGAFGGMGPRHGGIYFV